MRERNMEKRNKVKAGAAVIAIALLAVLSGVFAALYATARAEEDAADERYKSLAESTYRKSYYSLLYNVDGLENATNKLTVASGKALRQEYLADVTTYATAAAENMSDFTPEEAGDSRIMKFINQTGDFAKYLDDKLNKGGAISESDRATLEDARKHPENHRSLLVRKTGFSEFYISLSPQEQQEIIDRTEY